MFTANGIIINTMLKPTKFDENIQKSLSKAFEKELTS